MLVFHSTVRLFSPISEEGTSRPGWHRQVKDPQDLIPASQGWYEEIRSLHLTKSEREAKERFKHIWKTSKPELR